MWRDCFVALLFALPQQHHHDKRLPVFGKLGDLRMYDASIVVVAHAHCLPVRPRVEHDLVIFGQRGIDYGVKVKERTERWFGTDVALRK